MFKTKNEIRTWLDEMGVRLYTINDDLTVDVESDSSNKRDFVDLIEFKYRLKIYLE